MTHQEHQAHDGHRHGPDCGHEAVPHGDHNDYLHGSHRHALHEGHWDEHDASGSVRVADAESFGSSDSVGLSTDDSGSTASTWAAGPSDRPEGAGDQGGS